LERLKLGLEQIIPAFFLVAVLILIVPDFLRSIPKSKQVFNYLLIWSVIVACVMIVTYLIF
tara:strand:+ start:1174 stop:1356 length:183 start_codon:yes stop_codon:yes gene_type:complete